MFILLLFISSCSTPKTADYHNNYIITDKVKINQDGFILYEYTFKWKDTNDVSQTFTFKLSNKSLHINDEIPFGKLSLIIY